ncbi:MAG: hypothetical protein JW750_05245 [Anaerolineaceae bacterium]|nr:hypothetical protein [Anaerolineaceae bacterium]
MDASNLFWFIILVIAFVLLGIFSLEKQKDDQRKRYHLRLIDALDRFDKQLGMAVEDGTRVHVAVGSADLLDPNGSASLAGIKVVEQLAKSNAASDRPLVSTTSEGAVALMLQSRLRNTYRNLNLSDQYNPLSGRMTGPTPYSYIAGTLPVLHDEHVSVNVMVGQYGPEVGLLSEAAKREKSYLIGSSPSLTAQAVLYASGNEPLLAEEIYTMPAYLDPSPKMIAGVRVQDVLRLTLIGVMVAGSVLKLVGVL